MTNTETSFYGQQTDEKILYVARPHQLALTLLLAKFIAASFVLLVVILIIDQQQFLTKYAELIAIIGAIVAGSVAGVGFWIVNNIRQKNIAYITDRRVVKFELATPLATNMRSLSWEEAVKVKTFPPNALWKQLMIGSVVIHAKTTVAPVGPTEHDQVITDDDIEIKDVYYYRDLGNYIEKILFLYKKHPADVAALQPFVTREKGKRY